MHRQRFERRSAGDGFVIGKKIYRVDTQEYIGVAQAHWRDSGRSVLAVNVGAEGPAFFQLDEVLIEAPRTTPHIEVSDDELPTRDVSLHPADSPEWQRRRERASRAGAQDQVREPGISDVDAEPELPRHQDGVDYSKIPRPKKKEDGTDVYPAGGPVGRGRDVGQEEENDAPSGASPTQGGSTMASVGEVKAAIDAASHGAGEAQAMARAVIEKVNEVSQQYAAALEGGGHDSIAQAQNALQHSVQQFEEGIQAIAGAIEIAGQYGAGL